MFIYLDLPHDIIVHIFKEYLDLLDIAKLDIALLHKEERLRFLDLISSKSLTFPSFKYNHEYFNNMKVQNSYLQWLVKRNISVNDILFQKPNVANLSKLLKKSFYLETISIKEQFKYIPQHHHSSSTSSSSNINKSSNKQYNLILNNVADYCKKVKYVALTDIVRYKSYYHYLFKF